MNDLSIAIPSWNTRELLRQCLESVRRSSSGLSVETIVVDNASSDGSADMVAAEYPQAKLIRNRTNVGFAAACNLAFKLSSGRHFLLLNTDTILLDQALKSLVDFMDAHPGVGAAGCRLLNRDGTLQRSCSCFPSLLTELLDALYLSKLFPKSRLFGKYSMTYWDFDEVREVDFVGGSCLIVRREAISQVGLLDESFFMYTEEADWCYRLRQHGWLVYYYPGARAIHLGGESAQQCGKDMHLHLYAGRNLFIRKHRGRSAAAAHRSIVALGAMGRLPVYAARRVLHRDGAQVLRFQARLLMWAIRGHLDQPISADTEARS